MVGGIACMVSLMAARSAKACIKTSPVSTCCESRHTIRDSYTLCRNELMTLFLTA